MKPKELDVCKIDLDKLSKDFVINGFAEFKQSDSDIRNNRFIFEYTVDIYNNSDLDIVLLERYWVIIDSDGKRNEVEGAGVAGEIPKINAGEKFTYTSTCVLRTYWGTIEGSYRLQLKNGECFEVKIPRFFLIGNKRLKSDKT